MEEIYFKNLQRHPTQAVWNDLQNFPVNHKNLEGRLGKKNSDILYRLWIDYETHLASLDPPGSFIPLSLQSTLT